MTLLAPQDFQFLADLLKSRSGFVLGPEKGYLLESRLTPVARRRGLDDLAQLVKLVRQKPDETLLHEISEAMTINESFFFRDNLPFDTLSQHVLPALRIARTNSKRLRIWSAACSTGQEPYSIAMIFDQQRALWADWHIEIIATDLSSQAITKAQAGLYSQFEVQRGLPIKNLMTYFNKVGEQWQIAPSLQSKVKFRTFNLLHPLTSLGTFDVVFCRNVLIYFDAPTKTQVLEAIRRQMPADGNLFLGAAETVLGLTKAFKPMRDVRGLYVPSDGEAALAANG
ncbi:CheR family methyltransferase [Pedomonas mirosovicensis]|uniref:CheR family methyltransferase n=1 Tax=Pedomonas mirosovicensis TaxID=2908641 RepID=UPI0021695154|nr:protein-glutamate O-methyltransferase CheR [Pedomonas mirosovicensis]MCH8684655.1 protein-glutamate O-methyltransferase CheR [Pedomonas mirosovicensis]